jgi:hypothetical protein
VLDFEPDLVLYAANSREIGWMFKADHLQHLAQHDLLGQFPFVVEAMERAGVGSDPETLAQVGTVESRLLPHAEGALQALFASFRELGRRHGAETAMLLVEIPGDTPSRLDVFDRLEAAAGAAGLPVLSLEGVYAGVPDRTALWITPWDDHTNATGHRMLAARLYELLLERGMVPVEAAAGD